MTSKKRRCASPLNTASPTSLTTSTYTAPVRSAARPEVIDAAPCETGSQLTDFSNVGSTTAIHDRVMMPSVVVDPERTMDRRIGYLLMRLAVGFSLLGHGLVRIPKLAGFHASSDQRLHTFHSADDAGVRHWLRVAVRRVLRRRDA